MASSSRIPLLLLFLLRFSEAIEQSGCDDIENIETCKTYVIFGLCYAESYASRKCRETCGVCEKASTGQVLKEYNPQFLPPELQPLAKLLGEWRSAQFTGKVQFPSIPTFTYSETLSFRHLREAKAIAYTAFAWGPTNLNLHEESGFITVVNGSVVKTTVMDSGFNVVEKGTVKDFEIRLNSTSIGQMSFSHQPSVAQVQRIFTFNRFLRDTLEQEIQIATKDHSLQEHARIRYNKIYP